MITPRSTTEQQTTNISVLSLSLSLSLSLPLYIYYLITITLSLYFNSILYGILYSSVVITI